MADRDMKRKMISLMDLTTLDKERDTEDKVKQLVDQGSVANGLQTEVAAVCVYPEFIKAAKQSIAALQCRSMRVATVVNFPSGDGQLDEIRRDTQQALDLGADEIDLVICYKEYLEPKGGEAATAKSCHLVRGIKELIREHAAKGGQEALLKVILETGELSTSDLIRKASLDALENGADFLKTSTGKTPNGASLEAARVMLQVIKDSKRSVGLKISGGVRTFEDAIGYIRLVEEMLSTGASDFLRPETFRFGVSGLLTNLLREDSKTESGSAY